jgi:hypothetical protein
VKTAGMGASEHIFHQNLGIFQITLIPPRPAAKRIELNPIFTYLFTFLSFICHKFSPNFDGIVKSRIYRFSWIPACAGMTKRLKIAISYKDRHTRAGGYPDIRTTFYEFINFEAPNNNIQITNKF